MSKWSRSRPGEHPTVQVVVDESASPTRLINACCTRPAYRPFYLPPRRRRHGSTVPTDTTTTCPFRGEAVYWSLRSAPNGCRCGVELPDADPRAGRHHRPDLLLQRTGRSAARRRWNRCPSRDSVVGSGRVDAHFMAARRACDDGLGHRLERPVELGQNVARHNVAAPLRSRRRGLGSSTPWTTSPRRSRSTGSRPESTSKHAEEGAVACSTSTVGSGCAWDRSGGRCSSRGEENGRKRRPCRRLNVITDDVVLTEEEWRGGRPSSTASCVLGPRADRARRAQARDNPPAIAFDARDSSTRTSYR